MQYTLYDNRKLRIPNRDAPAEFDNDLGRMSTPAMSVLYRPIALLSFFGTDAKRGRDKNGKILYIWHFSSNNNALDEKKKKIVLQCPLSLFVLAGAQSTQMVKEYVHIYLSTYC